MPTTKELNEYIKHYLENDKTNSAIMLTAPWGTGKSYYIKNELIPFVDPDDENKCIVVSLYGLNDLHELSKSLYLEVRAKSLTKKSEKVNIGKIVAKTVVKGVASFFNIDLSANEQDLLKLYESIDLSGKLIVLEDLERSNINIISVMGYVNNLVEQDGVKVLLVANEKELLKYDEKPVKDEKGNKKISKVLTAETEEYLKIKEKTVSDTILFQSDTSRAIEDIMRSFNNRYFDGFLKEKNELDESKLAHEITFNIMRIPHILNENLRSFTYACQKTINIYDKIDDSFDNNFLKYLFLSITAFALRKKKNDKIKWIGDEKYSAELATYAYPLPRFCYDFITFQYLDVQMLKEAETLYCQQKLAESQRTTALKYLNVIYDYFECSEKDVLDSLNRIANELETTKSIPYVEYGKLANYLYSIKFNVGFDTEVERCKVAILNNLEEAPEDIIDRISIHGGIELDSEEQVAEFKLFKDSMIRAIKKHYSDSFDFDYSPEHLDDFYKTVHAKRDTYLINRVFAKKLENDKLIQLIEKCSSAQIRQINTIFHVVYYSNIQDFFKGDKEALIDLKDRLKTLMDTSKQFDKIQLLQLRLLEDNLEDIISRLDNE